MAGGTSANPLAGKFAAPKEISAYERLREAIVDGTIEPGTPLVEASVAEWCGVSRTPAREALSRLEQDGLLERNERGLSIRDRSPEEILDIYETRIILEAAAARVAAERHSRFDGVRLERLLRQAENVDESDPDALARYNREFHRGIWATSHNESMVDLLTRLDLHLMRYPATTLSYGGRWKSALEEHHRLVEAILGGDAEAAGEIATHHFTEARDIRLALWEDDAS